MSMVIVRRFLPGVAYCALAGTVFAVRGIPQSWDMLVAWILGALLCVSLGNLRAFGRSLLREWLPLLAALTLYDVLRSVGSGRVPIHAEFQIWLDRHVFGFGVVPTVWLQRHLWHPTHIRWYDDATWAVYMSYFVVTPLLLGVLWLADRARFRTYARRLGLLAFASVAFFTLSPTLPPWLASQKGLIAPVTRLVGPIGRQAQLFDATPLWERGVHLGNDIAAFPSLHEGMTVLVAIVLWRRAPRAVRPLLVAYPLAMALALTYAAEHYVSDVVAGTIFAAAAAYAEPRLLRKARELLARRRAPGALPSERGAELEAA